MGIIVILLIGILGGLMKEKATKQTKMSQYWVMDRVWGDVTNNVLLTYDKKTECIVIKQLVRQSLDKRHLLVLNIPKDSITEVLKK